MAPYTSYFSATAKKEPAVENFLFWATGYALIVDCVCSPGNCKPYHALTSLLLIAAFFFGSYFLYGSMEKAGDLLMSTNLGTENTTV